MDGRPSRQPGDREPLRVVTRYQPEAPVLHTGNLLTAQCAAAAWSALLTPATLRLIPTLHPIRNRHAGLRNAHELMNSRHRKAIRTMHNQSGASRIGLSRERCARMKIMSGMHHRRKAA